MKVTVEKVTDIELEKAHIWVASVTDEVQNAIDLLEGNRSRIPAQKDGTSVMCSLSHIYYLESVDKKTFLYTKEECYETKYRLYELEELLSAGFVRCSKSMIVNVRKINSVKSDFNGRMNAQLLNGETIVISRSYVKDLKKRLGL